MHGAGPSPIDDRPFLDVTALQLSITRGVDVNAFLSFVGTWPSLFIRSGV